MGYSRRQFIESAFEELGLAEYTFDMQPEQYQGAARRLDAMLMTWNGRGLRLGPNISATAAGADLAADMGIPDIANEAIILNLAIRLAPSYGKTVSPDTKASALEGKNTLFARFAKPIPQRFPHDLPLGAGNKPWRYGNPFVLPEAEPLLANDDSVLELK
jgi:hypothetical protein